MDALRDHRRIDRRHDLVGHRVRYNAKMGASRGHRLRVGDRHRTDFHDVDDGNLDVNLCHRMNDPLVDQSLVVMMVLNHDHRMNDLLVDQNLGDGHHDDLVDHHKNVTDDQNDLMTDVSRANRNCALHDLNLVVMTDVSLCHRMNDLLADRSLGVNRANRNCVRRDLKTDENLDVNHVNRNYVLPDQKMDGNLGGNLCHRMNDLLDGHLMGVNRVNRNCAPRDLKMDGNLDAMSHRVMLMVCLSKSCDQMSRDHLRCGHLKMRRRDMNRMDGKNLDGSHPKKDDPMNLRRVNRRMTVCPKMDDRKMI